MKKYRLRKFTSMHPVISYMLLVLITLIFSFVLFKSNSQSTYSLYSSVTEDFSPVTEAVIPLLNLSGLKYIFTNSVTNFANFSAFTNLIIILIGIGIIDKSGFLETIVTMLTKKVKKKTVTFSIMFLCMLASIMGEIAFVIFIPLIALFFYYGKRNPLIGIVSSFAALSLGSGINVVFNSVDSSLSNITILNSMSIQSGYDISIYSLYFINLITIIILSFVLTLVTENYISKKVNKYEFDEEELVEDVVTDEEKNAMVKALCFGFIYFLIIFYNILPGLPYSGNLLDNSQALYINKLFSHESFFANGFVFIVTFQFIVWGLTYGIYNKTIRNNKEFIDGLTYSLEGIGKTLLLIFTASIFISVLRQTNIGDTLVVFFASSLTNFEFTGFPLVILLMLVAMVSNIFVPSSITKWSIIASMGVPLFMHSGYTPEFAQFIFRLGESITTNLTPTLSYFVIYLAYLEKYNQTEKNIGITKAIKYQMPYSFIAFLVILLIVGFFFITNLPLGLSSSISL